MTKKPSEALLKKLMVVMALVLIPILGAVFVQSYQTISLKSKLARGFEGLSQEGIVSMKRLAETQGYLFKVSISLRDILLAPDQATRDGIIERRTKNVEGLVARLGVAKEKALPSQKPVIAEVEQAVGVVAGMIGEFDKKWQSNTSEGAVPDSVRVELSQQIWKVIVPARDSVEKALVRLGELQVEEAMSVEKSSVQEIEGFQKKIISGLVVVFLVSVVGVFFLVRTWLLMRREFLASAALFSKETEQLLAESERLKGMGQEALKAAEQQSGSLQSTSSALEQISAMVNKNAEASMASMDRSSLGLKVAEKGKESIEQVIAATQQIRGTVEKVERQIENNDRKMAEVVQMIGEISGKAKVINDIVFQTKLLSFNASVEAARAGEHGKGFSVVAEEVGNLAQQSGRSAVEIDALLTANITKVKSIIEENRHEVSALVKETRDGVDQGVAKAEECGSSFQELLNMVQELASSTSEISRATQEQASGVKEVAGSIVSLDSAAKLQKKKAEDTLALALGVSQGAVQLEDCATSLEKMMIGGSKAA
jgi:methyl-accepting chemotaxis protein